MGLLGEVGFRHDANEDAVLAAMKTGYVDETWAREHHEDWYDDIKAGRLPAQRSGDASPATTGVQAQA